MKVWEEIETVLKDVDGPLPPKAIHSRMVAAGFSRSLETVRGELQIHCTRQLNNKKRNEPLIFESVGGGKWRLNRGTVPATAPLPPAPEAPAPEAETMPGNEPTDNTRFSYLLALLWAVAGARAADVEGVRVLVNRGAEDLVRARGHTVENYAGAFNKRILGVPREEFFTMVLAALQGDASGLEAQIRRAPSYAEYLRTEGDAESRLARCLNALRGPKTPPPPTPTRPLREAVPAVHAALEAAGWVFEPWQIAAYITALRTKPFVILGGVSGTGKSELPGLVNEIVGGARHTRVSVRPDWTDSSDLLGYRDLNHKFLAGDLAEAAKAASSDRGRFHVCVIDEMNIARIEHYFAEVLSAIEDRGADDGGSGALLGAHLAGGEPDLVNLRIPRNLALVGTVNMDESTFGFSKKVLDRAFTIELSNVDLGNWRRGASSALAAVPIAIGDLIRTRRRLADLTDASDAIGRTIDQIIRDLGEVNALLAPAQLHLGYRSRDEIVLFVLNAEEVSGSFKASDGSAVSPLDLALMMKVLPRISGGSRTVRLSLAQLLCWACSRAVGATAEELATTLRDEWVQAGRPGSFGGKRFPRTAARLCLMWDRMAEEGFTSFWI